MFKVFPGLLVPIFILALILRFLYFPNNINFAYDQARDSFVIQDILKGDFKIIGPPTTISDKIFHGVLFYYLLAPVYFLFNGSPEVGAFLLRILNAMGIFLIFLITKNLFNSSVGLIAAFLFAISFEQTQYALFFGHPALGAITVLIYYLGLSWWFFKNNPYGFVVTLVGLGVTLQFEDVNGFLVFNLFIYLVVFYKKLKLLNLKIVLLGVIGFLLTISTFILAEIKYNFRTTTALVYLVSQSAHKTTADLEYMISIVSRYLHDNFLNINNHFILLCIFTLLIFWAFKQKRKYHQVVFLLIWFFVGLLPHFLSPHNFSYYYSPGVTIGVLILVAFLIYQINTKIILAFLILTAIILSNLNLIIKETEVGPNSDIVIQPGMLISNQKKVLDYIYQKADGVDFSVNGLTIPLNVNTTWSYLFQWYGQDKYNYLPVWASSAFGFPGNLKIEIDRSKLPEKRFTIIEPTVGIGKNEIEDFFREENYFTKIVEEKEFSTIKVQFRKSY